MYYILAFLAGVAVGMALWSWVIAPPATNEEMGVDPTPAPPPTMKRKRDGGPTAPSPPASSPSPSPPPPRPPSQ